MRPSIRLAALMEQHVVYVFTHDSIFLGEDGPTHQPIEHHLALRAIPHLVYLRPADACETVEAWRWALTHRGGPGGAGAHAAEDPGPRAMRRARARGAAARRLRPGRPGAGRAAGDPDGHRLGGAPRARGPRRAGQGRDRHAGREPAVLGALRSAGRGVPRVGAPGERRARGWRSRPARRSAGSATSDRRARSSGRDGFGASAPWKDVAKKFGFTAAEVVRRARALLS